MMARDLYPHRGGRNVRRALRVETIHWTLVGILAGHVAFVVIAFFFK